MFVLRFETNRQRQYHTAALERLADDARRVLEAAAKAAADKRNPRIYDASDSTMDRWIGMREWQVPR